MKRSNHRPSALIALVAAVASSAACGDNAPCSTCPAIAGTYALSFTSSTLSADCQTLHLTAPASGSLAIAQLGSHLTAQFGALTDFSGAVSAPDIFDLAEVSGDGGPDSDSSSFRGTQSALDGGTGSISGQYQESHGRTSSSGASLQCLIQTRFAGPRQ